MEAQQKLQENKRAWLNDEFAEGRAPQITEPLSSTCPGLKKAAKITKTREANRKGIIVKSQSEMIKTKKIRDTQRILKLLEIEENRPTTNSLIKVS